VPAVAYRAGGDFTYLQLAFGYLIGRVVVAGVLLPAYFKGELYTAYALLQDRFGGATRKTATVLFLITRTLGDGLRLFLAAKVLEQIWASAAPGAGGAWVLPAAVVAVGAATIFYTYVGGMKAVIWTDVLQFFVYMMGALVALYLLLRAIPGGLPGLLEQAAAAGKLRVLDFSLDLTRPYTFWAGVLGGMVLNTATHGADQLMVQRYLSARSERQAAGALITSGVVVLVQFALFLLIGVALWSFYQVQPPRVALGRDEEFTYFIVNHLPTGIVGLVVAAIFSAAMSTLSGSLNASASATVNDLLRPLLPTADDVRLLRLARRMTAFWGLAQMGVALLAIGLQDNVVNNALAVASFITGIVLGVFVLGVCTRRVDQRAALAGLVAGIAVVGYAAMAPRLGEPLRSAIYPFAGALAWPWYALLGSSTVIVVGLLASRGASGPAVAGVNPEEHA
jgi:SSS family transporter